MTDVSIIKDCIFERVMAGEDIRSAVRNVHFIDGFTKEDALSAFNEMKKEVEEEE